MLMIKKKSKGRRMLPNIQTYCRILLLKFRTRVPFFKFGRKPNFEFLIFMKGATEELYVKVTTKRERASGALNGTLLCVPLSASHKILFWKKGLLKNVILIFQSIKKTIKDGSLFAKCKKNNTLPKGNTVEEIIPLKDRIEVQP